MKLVLALLLAVSSPFALAEKSPKKIEADNVQLTPPQVLEKGDNLFSGRFTQGDVFDSKPFMGVVFEHMMTNNFGLGGQFHYANYTDSIETGGFKGTWGYKAYVYVLFGTLHFDYFQVKNLDTYFTAGVGRTEMNVTWSSDTLPDPGTTEASSTYLVGYFTARYFANSNWAFSASLGLPIGTLSLGLDYLF